MSYRPREPWFAFVYPSDSTRRRASRRGSGTATAAAVATGGTRRRFPSMLVKDAKAVVRRWVAEEVSQEPGFVGAYFAGSILGLTDDAVLPTTSDLDVNVVWQGPRRSRGRGKFVRHGVLIEVTSLSLDQVPSPHAVLGHYHLAGGFRSPQIILDPTGHLGALGEVVSRDYARREWVRRRCDHAARRVVEQLAALDEAALLHDQVIGWLFPTGVLTHVLLVAGLRNPTVRRRYAAARELLAELGRMSFYEPLLALLGCAQMTSMSVERHLDALAPAFDAAREVIRTPVPFASDISAAARPIAIDGSRMLIHGGLHREAVFWLVATYSRCIKVLSTDGGDGGLVRRFEPGYRALLGELGIASFADLRRRGEEVREFLPRVREEAEAIADATPSIVP